MTQTLARPVLVLRLPQPRPLPRDESFEAFVHDRRAQLLRTALLLCAGAPERAEAAGGRAALARARRRPAGIPGTHR